MEYDFVIDNTQMRTEFKVRAAIWSLNWDYNPADAYDEEITEEWYMEACGLIPDFFVKALDEWAIENGESETVNGKQPTLSEIAERMDTIYGFGGFRTYLWKGIVLENGTFEALPTDDDEQDPPLHPYVKLTHQNNWSIECFVYPYGVVTLRDHDSGKTMTARFD
tara:strand:+ start:401 stop:895 length:495 start_codon:yes stop_codon:yes gene_type:complete